MATKATVAGKAQVIQATHEREVRQTNLGTDWNEVRIGFIGLMVPTANDDAAATLEDVAIASYVDWFCFGLMNNVLTIPGQLGTNFVGTMTKPTADVTYTATRCIDNSATSGGISLTNGTSTWNQMYYGSIKDTTVLGGGNVATGGILMPQFSGDGRGGFFGMKLEVVNKGLATQTIKISIFQSATAQVTTPANAKATLRALLTGSAYTLRAITNWNSGGAAMVLPDTWFLRSPFLNNRIRWAVKGGLLIS